MQFNKSKLALAIIMAASPLAYAEETLVLDEITVTAEDQVKQQLGVSIISKEDLEKRPVMNDVSEILRTMPGVNLTSNSATSNRGNKRQIDLRGMGPENTLILVDGKPVTSRNSERYGRSGDRNTRGDSNWVPVEMIDSIEVLRGPAAARYGSGAMGGVVNIKTKPTTNQVHGHVSYYINQPESSKEGNTNRVGFSLSGPVIDDVLNFRLYGSWNKTKPDATDINATVNDGSTTIAGREGVRNKDIAGRLDWTINENHKLSLDAGFSRQGNIYNGDTQTSAGLGVTDQVLGSETARLYRQNYSLTHEGKYGWGDSRTYFSYDQTVNSHLKESYTGRTEGSYGSQEMRDSKLKNYRFNSELHIPFKAIFDQMLTLGFEAVHSSLTDANIVDASSSVTSTSDYFPSNRTSHTSQSEWAAFVEDNIAVTNHTFLTPAIRFDYNTKSGSNVSGGLNVVHNLTENWKFKGGIARAYKAPNLYQTNPNYLLTSNGNGCPVGTSVSCYLVGNENLKPETSWNKEVGLEYVNDEFTSSVAYFHNDYRNKITAGTEAVGQVGTMNVYRWENVKSAVVEGVEGNLTIPLIAERLRWVNNFTYMIQSKNKETGNPLSVIPKYTLNSSLNWIINHSWDANFTYTQYGRQKPRTNPEMRIDSRSMSDTELGSYAVFGLNVGYNWSKTISTRIGISNLLNKRIYRSNDGAVTYNEPGRAYYATVKYTF